MKRQQNNLCVKDLSKIGKTDSRNNSSNYSTCSDDLNENFQKNSKVEDVVRESTILSGQIIYEHTHIDIALGESVSSATPDSETSYPINILDQNIDVLEEDDDVFLDCNDASKSDTNDSTVYVPLSSEVLSNQFSAVKSSNHFYNEYEKLNSFDSTTNKEIDLENNRIEKKRFTTIQEVTEITQASTSVRKESPSYIQDRTGGMVVEVINKINEIDNLNKNSPKRVLFVNEDNAIENVNYRNKKSILRQRPKSPYLLGRKGQCCSNETVIDENCNVHNTTESFVMWEKFCKTSESSRSFFSECYGGDDEISTSYKTLDDTYLSNCSNDLSEKVESQRKFYRHRSKSCDSILREVRHLPHIVFDKFLKCLSEEIENIRRKNVVCTCNIKNTKKYLCKQKAQNVKATASVPVVQVENVDRGRSLTKGPKSPKLQPKGSPYKAVKESRLSPISVTNRSENISRNQKSPKTPTNSQKRGFYSFQKEIVSPVGEYIRGKRPNPFHSPSKKKV